MVLVNNNNPTATPPPAGTVVSTVITPRVPPPTRKYELEKSYDIVELNEATHTVYGLASSETPDKEGEIFDYTFGKQAIQKWSDSTFAQTSQAAGMEPSRGNIRIMHGLELGGKVTRVDYKDDKKEIWIETEPVDDSVWMKIKKGFLRAFSIGGDYAWKKDEVIAGKSYVRFGANISEISYVDAPCNPDAIITVVKADGSRVPLQTETIRIEDVAAQAKNAATVFSKAIEDLAAFMKTRESTGRFTVQATGEAHDFLTNSGYSHELTGSSSTMGDALGAGAMHIYKNGVQSVSIYSDGSWEYDDGHARRTNGVSLGTLRTLLDTAKAAEDAMQKTEIENLQKMLPFRFTTEQLSRMIKGEDPQFTVGEVLHLERVKKLDAEAEAKDELEDNLADDEDNPVYVRSALANFDKKEFASEDEKNAAWKTLIDAAKKHGVEVDEETAKASWNELTVGQVLELAKFKTLTKSMWNIPSFVGVLANLRDIAASSAFEAVFEGDGADATLANDLKSSLEDLVASFRLMCDEETTELLESLNQFRENVPAPALIG